MHKTLMNLSDRLCRDIDESAHEEKLTPATMEMLDKAVDIIKDIETIRAMEEYGDNSYDAESYARGGRRGRNSYNSYERGYSRGDDMMRMSERDRRMEDYMR